MNKRRYLDFLAKMGINSAHPGGKPLTEALLLKEQLKADEKVLDVGCGAGETSFYIANQYHCEVTGLDLHPEMIKQARVRAEASPVPFRIIQGNVESMPLKDQSFDRLLAESVTVFTQIPLTLKEYYRVLKKGGKVLAIEMTLEKPLTNEEVQEIQNLYGATKLLTVDDWRAEFNKAGFSEVEVIRGEHIINGPQGISDVSTFNFSNHLDLEAFEVWWDHIQLMDKYRGILGYRIYKAIK
ncbi:class I SAM-dependent methyltransferase [Scopulibacillus cellulosilyticus]|uniref:Methyltransferase domain-containing protein n=1 Tax=Scopulibacillus cellulosilyticus TaxID=2665665 RepID=A0ABW2PXF6_9BACL